MGLQPCGLQVVVKVSRTFLSRHLVRNSVIAVQGQHLQQCSVASWLLLPVVPRGMPQALFYGNMAM
ncbi:hypothetical protein Taro_037162 [Colocasia esculenta]|uniref:Uncharacterized protein n=1 Tax=Colocasia esculenta TaxID=4460 RepID=A0A843WNV2_COLES|nr:hypothetical protein [Colocasia esculenta]